MKRIAIALLFFAARIAGAQSQLHITGGDAITVKVDKVVIVKEDRLVVRALPFKLVASAGGADYRWTIPAGVTATEADDALTVTAAPKGEFTVSCRILVVDFEQKATKRTIESLTFNVGDVGPTPPPPPPPPTPSPLQKVLQVAYDVETDPAKAANVLKFADILEGSVAAAKAGGRVKTAGDFVMLTKQATDLAIGPAAIPGIRKSVGNYLQTVLPREANTPANESYFSKVASEHGYVALALRGIK
jgi:hypothetical protein